MEQLLPSAEADTPEPEMKPEDAQDPEDVGGDGCRTGSGSWPRTLRGPEGVELGLELGRAVAYQQGYAVSALRSSHGQEALVFVFDGEGREKEISLGRVFGGASPPLLMSHGSNLIALVFDSEASGRKMSVVKIEEPWLAAKLTHGPELSVARDESEAASLAMSPNGHLRIVWDEEKGKVSSVLALELELSKLSEPVKPKVLSLVDKDVDSPLLLADASSDWLLYLAYDESSPGDKGEGEADAKGLLAEPPASLRVLRWDGHGALSSHALALSAKSQDVAEFDALASPEGLWVVYRQSGGGPNGQLQLLLVRPDGSLQMYKPDFSLWGSEPVRLVEDAGKPSLFGRGLSGEALRLDLSSSEGHTEVQKELAQREVLGFGPLGVLAFQSRGADVDFFAMSCSSAKPSK